MVLFIILSMIDLILSWLLLDFSIEANPIQSFIWENFGFAGVAAFKVFFTSVACICIHFIGKYNRVYQKRLLLTIYSILLIPISILIYIYLYKLGLR